MAETQDTDNQMNKLNIPPKKRSSILDTQRKIIGKGPIEYKGDIVQQKIKSEKPPSQMDSYLKYLKRLESESVGVKRPSAVEPDPQQSQTVSDAELDAMWKNSTKYSDMKEFLTGEFPNMPKPDIETLYNWGLKNGPNNAPFFTDRAGEEFQQWFNDPSGNAKYIKGILGKSAEIVGAFGAQLPKWGLQLLAGGYDIPYGTVLGNMSKWLANTKTNYFSEVDPRYNQHMLYNYDTLHWNHGLFQGYFGSTKPWHEYAADLEDKQLGLSKWGREFAEEVTKSMDIPKHEKDFFYHLTRFGVDWSLPGLGGIPWMAGARFYSKVKRKADDFLLENYIHGKKQKMIDDGVPLNTINDELNIIRDAYKNADNYDAATNTVTLPDGTKMKARLDPSKELKNIIDMRYFNATMGATAMTGSAYAIMNNVPGWDKYKDFALLAGFPGLFFGASGIIRGATRLPLGAAPLLEVGGALGGLPPTSALINVPQIANILPAKWYWQRANKWIGIPVGSKLDKPIRRGVMWTLGMFSEALKDTSREWKEFSETVAGKFMRSQAAGVPIADAIRILKEGGDIEAAMKASMMPKAVLHLKRFVDSMGPEQREAMEKSLKDAGALADRLNNLGGLERTADHFFFIDQVTQLGLLSSHRDMVMAAAKFGDGALKRFGPLSSLMSGIKKASGFNKSRNMQLFSMLEINNQMVANQVGGLVEALERLRKNTPTDKYSSNELNKILERADDLIAHHTKQIEHTEEVMQDFFTAHQKLVGGVEQLGLKKTMASSYDEGGLWNNNFSNVHRTELYNPQTQVLTAKEISKANANDFRTHVRDLISGANKRVRGESRKLYDNVNKDLLIPMNKTVEKLTDEIVQQNPVIQRMLREKGITESTLDAFTEMGRKQYLDLPNVTDDVVGGMTVQIEQLIDSGSKIYYKGSLLDSDKFVKLIDESEDARQILAGLNAKTADDLILLNETIPSVIKVDDALKLRSALYTSAEKLSKSEGENSVWYRATTQANDIDLILKDDLSDPVAKLILSKQGLDETAIARELDARQKAVDYYRENIGKSWKTSLGLNFNVHHLRHAVDEDRFLQFLIPAFAKGQTGDEGVEVAIDVFNRMFPKGGKDRDAAQRALAHSIATKLIDPDGGIAFVRKIDRNVLERFAEEGILPKDNIDNLSKYVRAVQEKLSGYADPHYSPMLKDLQRRLHALPESKKAALENSFLKGLSGTDKTGTNMDTFIETVLMNYGAKSSRVRKDQIEVIRKGIDDSVEESQKLMDEVPVAVNTPELQKELAATRDAVIQEAENAAKTGVRSQREASNVKQLLELFDDDIGLINNFENVIHNWVYQNSFEFTSFQRANIIESAKPVSLTYPQAIDKLQGRTRKDLASLQMDVDPVKLGQNIDIVRRAMKEIVEHKRNLARRLNEDGKTELAQAMRDNANETAESLARLEDIGGAAIYTRGKLPTVGLKSFPLDFTDSQVASRIYSWARDVVGPQYLATEAGIKAFHKNHADLLTKLLFTPEGTKILHDVMVKKTYLTEGDQSYKQLVNIVLKTFTRTGTTGEDREQLTPELTEERFEATVRRSLNFINRLIPNVPEDAEVIPSPTSVLQGGRRPIGQGAAGELNFNQRL